MTQRSFPIIEQNVTIDQWKRINGTGDGIVNDLTGNSFGLSTVTDTATIQAGMFRYDGLVFEVQGSHAFTLPAVSAATTYQIAIVYTPANEALEDVGPLKMVAGVKGSIATPTAGAVFPVWDIPRTPSTPMSAATVVASTDYRRWACEVELIRQPSNTPNPALRPPLPRGSVLHETTPTGVRTFLRDLVSGSLQWVSVDDPTGWVDCSLAGGKSFMDGVPVQVRREGKKIYIHGGWTRAGIVPETQISLGNVPSGFRPRRTTYINAVGSTGNQYGMFVITVGGIIYVRSGAVVSDYYAFPGELNGWFTD